MEEIIIEFAPDQKLPPGYKVVFSKSDERYRFVINETEYSFAFRNALHAYRSAWFNYAAKQRAL